METAFASTSFVNRKDSGPIPIAATFWYDRHHDKCKCMTTYQCECRTRGTYVPAPQPVPNSEPRRNGHPKHPFFLIGRIYLPLQTYSAHLRTGARTSPLRSTPNVPSCAQLDFREGSRNTCNSVEIVAGIWNKTSPRSYHSPFCWLLYSIFFSIAKTAASYSFFVRSSVLPVINQCFRRYS